MDAIFARGARERRALNIIWSAAGRDDFLPDFLGFHEDGSPDLYLNAIVGLTYRCYDAAALAAFREELDTSWLGRTFSGLYWLALESAAYDHCRSNRPALVILRRQHAARYLADNEDLAMQRLMMRDDLVHALKAARCRAVLGQPPGLLNPWEKRLYDALAFDGAMTTEDIIAALRDVLRRFFVFRYGVGRSCRGLRFSVGAGLAALLRRLLPTPPEETVTPRLVSGRSPAGAPGIVEKLLGNAPPDNPVKMLKLFPRPLLAEETRRTYEQAFCTGIHRKVHLYFAASRRDEGQRAANLAAFRAQGARCRVAIRRLAGRILNTLAVCREPIPLRAGRGRFCPRFVWQALYRQDGRVFTASRSVRFAGFSVTLLLDASYSRAGQQAEIATQAYIIAAALAQAGIPLQIVAFCSLAGSTVLHRMKSFDAADNGAVFDYAAAGWNRDGLALRAVRPLLKEGTGVPLLLVLTDARPSDDHPIPGAAVRPMARDYTGEAAAADTAAEVRALRRQGVRVVGLLQSEVAGAAETARQIFGESFARIERVDQLAAAVARLIEGQIRQSAQG